MKRTVFFISDGTGITVANLGNSLLTQFSQVKCEKILRPFIDTPEKAKKVIDEVKVRYEEEGEKPILFTTIVNENILKIIQESTGILLDFFHHYVEILEKEFAQTSEHHIGLAHGMQNKPLYNVRMDAVNYALSCDDGTGMQQYGESDVILIGVSRCGKTPTSLYLALQFGIYAANYPFTDEDFERYKTPDFIKAHKNKLFGLTIDPVHLHEIRTQRRPNSDYASLNRCRQEVSTVEELFRKEKIPYLDTTTRSIEELSTTIISTLGLKRRDI